MTTLSESDQAELEERIGDSQELYRELQGEAAAEKAQRDALIVQAVEAGMTQVWVADVASLSRAQVTRILADAWADDGDDVAGDTAPAATDQNGR